VWDASQYEEVFSIVAVDMVVNYQASVVIDDKTEIRSYSATTKIFVESGWIRKTGDSIPTLSRPLTIISAKPWILYLKNKEAGIDRDYGLTIDPTLTPVLTLLEKTTFGEDIIQTSASYQIFPTKNIGNISGRTISSPPL
jgi:hypothetical protein